MAARQLPDPELLRKLLRYDPETGKLYWRERPAHMFCDSGRGGRFANAERWNLRWAGQEAFTTVSPRGYLMGTIFYIRLGAHRVAWAIATGHWPEYQIDHINGRESDNRLCNLRCATPSQNSMNRRLHRNNSSGQKGVDWCNKKRRWRARICANGTRLNLGYFRTIEAAQIAYREASKRLHKEFRR